MNSMRPNWSADKFARRSGQRQITLKIALLVSLVLFSSTFVAPGSTVVIPNVATSLEGGVGLAFPFDLADDPGEVPSGTQRYQQVYASNQFTNVAAGGEFITRIAFRPDVSFGLSSNFSVTLPSIRIDLSTTTVAPDGLSSNFVSNVGADNVTVYGGASGAPLPLSSAYTPAGAPKNFDIIINLTTPFFYNPAAGNLLLDVRNFGGGKTVFFDAQSTTGDSISTVFTKASGVNSATADWKDTAGLVTRFTSTNSVFFQTFKLLPPNSCWMTLFGVPNKKYAIDAATVLTNGGNWTVLVTNTTSASGSFNYTNASVSSFPQRYFRARLAQ
jgi:hypothetical protein